MTRTRRILRWSAWTLVALLVVIPLLWMTAVPWLVRRQVIAALRDAGFPDADLTVAGVSLSSATLTDVRLDKDGRLRLGTVAASYSLGSLWNGRLHELDVSGATWDIRFRDGKLDLGLPPGLSRGRQPAATKPAPLPLDRLRLRAATVTLDGGNFRAGLPVEVEIEQTSKGELGFNFEAAAAIKPVRVAGRITPDQTGWQVDVTADVGPIPLGIQGTITTAGETELTIINRPNSDQLSKGIAAVLKLTSGGGNAFGVSAQLKGSWESLDFRAWHIPASFRNLQFTYRLIAGPDSEMFLSDLSIKADELEIAEQNAMLESCDLFTETEGGTSLHIRATKGDDLLDLYFRVDALGSVLAGTGTTAFGFGAEWDGELPSTLLRYLEPLGIKIPAPLRVKADVQNHMGWLRFEDGRPWHIRDYGGDIQAAVELSTESIELTDRVRLDGLTLKSLLLGKVSDSNILILGINTELFVKDAAVRGVNLQTLGNSFQDGLSLLAAKDENRIDAKQDENLFHARQDDAGYISITIPKTSPRSWRAKWSIPQIRTAGMNIEWNNRDLGCAIPASHLTLTGTADTNAATIGLLLDTDGPLSVRAVGADLLVDGLASESELAWDRQTGIRISTQGLAANVGVTTHEATELNLSDVQFIVPYTEKSQPGNVQPVPGEFTVETIMLGQDELPGVSGTLAAVGRRIEFTAASALAEAATLTAEGSVNLDADDRRALLAVSLPKTDLSALAAYRRFVPGLADYDLSGHVAVQADASYIDGRLTPDIRIQLDDVSIKHAERDMAAEGITGTVVIDGLSPLHTPPSQLLAIKSAHSGKLGLIDGSVAFRAESTGTLFVEKTLWHTRQGGTLQAHAVRVGADQTGVDFDLFIEDLNVAEWITLFSDETVEAQGRLYCKLPVRYAWAPEPAISLGEGFLYAKPGTTGWVKIQRRDVVEDVIDRTGAFNASIADAAAAEVQRQLREKVISALTNFEFTVLTFDFIHEEGKAGILCRMKTAGSGREGEKPIPIGELVVNFRGIEDFLSLRLFSTR